MQYAEQQQGGSGQQPAHRGQRGHGAERRDRSPPAGRRARTGRVTWRPALAGRRGARALVGCSGVIVAGSTSCAPTGRTLVRGLRVGGAGTLGRAGWGKVELQVWSKKVERLSEGLIEHSNDNSGEVN